MPKRLYQIKDFLGGLNNLKDPADIADNEVADVSNLTFTKQGAIGGAFNMRDDTNNLLSAYNTTHIDHLEAGYGLGYFETDHRGDGTNSNSLAIVGTTTGVDHGFLSATSGDRTYMYAINDGAVKNSPSDGSNGNEGDNVNLHLWFPTGTEIIISGSEQGSGGGLASSFDAGLIDGVYTVTGGNGGTEIYLDRTPSAMLPTAVGGGNIPDPLIYFSATVTGIESGDKVLLLAHPDEHKIDRRCYNFTKLFYR